MRPAIVAWLPYRSASGARHTLQLVGTERGEPLLPWSTAEGLPEDLRAPGRIAIDDSDLSRLELRPPLVGARVVVQGTANEVVTDAEGRFAIDELPEGELRLLIGQPNF